MNKLKSYVEENILPYVRKIQNLQSPNGSIQINKTQAIESFNQLVVYLSKLDHQVVPRIFLEAFKKDASEWIKIGLENKPDFFRTQEAFCPPLDGEITLFIGPAKCQNSIPPRGYFLECFLAQREEAVKCLTILEKFPHPKNACQSTRLITGSRGFMLGNCIVFFPETVASSVKVNKQKYALFFFNKFKEIYVTHTMPVVNSLLGSKDLFTGKEEWISTEQTADKYYFSRCIWGYLHDYFHHTGPRPFDENIQLKLNWYVGLLEELKVDCQTILACYNNDFDFRQEVIQFVLFERLFRYPLQEDAEQNFDSGTGFLLFEFLFKANCILENDGRISLNLKETVKHLGSFISAVEQIELTEDGSEIIAKSKEFVSRYLNIEKSGQRRFVAPENYIKLVKENSTAQKPIQYADFEY